MAIEGVRSILHFPLKANGAVLSIAIKGLAKGIAVEHCFIPSAYLFRRRLMRVKPITWGVAKDRYDALSIPKPRIFACTVYLIYRAM